MPRTHVGREWTAFRGGSSAAAATLALLLFAAASFGVSCAAPAGACAAPRSTVAPATPTALFADEEQPPPGSDDSSATPSTLFRPIVSSSAAVYGKPVTFSAAIQPQGAAVAGTSTVCLYHLETKSVSTTVNGKKKTVSVNYWRLRRTLTMQGCPDGVLKAQGKLPYAGRWQAQVTYAGSGNFGACTSTVSAFVVEDPRIEPAIAWALRRCGAHAWDHYCLRFIGDAYARGAKAVIHRYRTAKQAADALHASVHPSANAPRGALVFYHSMHGRTDLGHVGISLGNGTMVNDNGGQGVKVMPIKSSRYIGWAAPPVSPAITDWNLPTGS